MYTEYFGLKDKPFSIAPNPEYVYMSRHHQEALAHLMYGIQEDGCLALLTGDVGTGKTTICRCLLDKAPQDTDIAVVFNPKLSSIDLLRTICEELNIDYPKTAEDNKTYVDLLNQHLLRSHADGKTTVLIIDEAQGLTPNVLEQLRLLTNLETNTHKLLKIVLLGQPELTDILKRPNLTQVNQRITSRYHLAPLNPDDIIAYVLHRMHVAGGGQSRFFGDSALKLLCHKSKGVPRVINLICDRALLGAYAENRSTVDKQIMKQAAQEVLAPSKKSKKRNRSFATVMTICLIALLTVGSFYLLQKKPGSNGRITIGPLLELNEAFLPKATSTIILEQNSNSKKTKELEPE